jgi:hypothetical protein
MSMMSIIEKYNDVYGVHIWQMSMESIFVKLDICGKYNF